MSNVAKKWVQNINSTLRRNSSANCSNGTLASFRNDGLNSSWIHKPEALINAHVEYIVRYFGDVPVDQPKGNQAIKEAVRILQLQFDIKKSQGITKLPRVELHVGVKGVKILDPKSRMILHNLPLHRISFCADDRNDKRLFAFIVKQSSSDKKKNANSISESSTGCNGTSLSGDHRCFVFLSDKLAEHITLTIGQAFDLAYRQFLDSSTLKNGENTPNSEAALRKLINLLRKRIHELERENGDLKQKLAQEQRAVTSKTFDQNETLSRHNIPISKKMNWESFESLHSLNHPQNDQTMPPQVPLSPVPPPPAFVKQFLSNSSTTADRNENTTLNKEMSLEGATCRYNPFCSDSSSDVFDMEFDPRGGDSGGCSGIKKELWTSENTFDSENEELAKEIERNNALLAEMREGYRRGLALGQTDFSANDQPDEEISNELVNHQIVAKMEANVITDDTKPSSSKNGLL